MLVLGFRLCLILGSMCLIIACDEDKSCIRPSGSVTEEERPVSGVNRVQHNAPYTIHIDQSNRQKLTVRGSDNLLPNTTTEIVGTTLHFGQTDCVTGSNDVEAFLSLEQLHAITLNGSGRLVCSNRFTSQEAAATLNGSGSIDYNVLAENFDADLIGSGILQLRGSLRHIDISVNGSGNVRALEAPATSATVRLNGSGTCRVHVSDSLRVTITGSGAVFYAGQPTFVDSTITGSGRLIRLE